MLTEKKKKKLETEKLTRLHWWGPPTTTWLLLRGVSKRARHFFMFSRQSILSFEKNGFFFHSKHFKNNQIIFHSLSHSISYFSLNPTPQLLFSKFFSFPLWDLLLHTSPNTVISGYRRYRPRSTPVACSYHCCRLKEREELRLKERIKWSKIFRNNFVIK